MKSRATAGFWRALASLPKDVRRQARRAFQLFEKDSFHPSLHFKELDGVSHTWSVRVGLAYRALGIRKGGEVTWFWIGSHADYDRLATF